MSMTLAVLEMVVAVDEQAKTGNNGDTVIMQLKG